MAACKHSITIGWLPVHIGKSKHIHWIQLKGKHAWIKYTSAVHFSIKDV